MSSFYGSINPFRLSALLFVLWQSPLSWASSYHVHSRTNHLSLVSPSFQQVISKYKWLNKYVTVILNNIQPVFASWKTAGAPYNVLSLNLLSLIRRCLRGHWVEVKRMRRFACVLYSLSPLICLDGAGAASGPPSEYASSPFEALKRAKPGKINASSSEVKHCATQSPCCAATRRAAQCQCCCTPSTLPPFFLFFFLSISI